jgi:hypothetical protein
MTLPSMPHLHRKPSTILGFAIWGTAGFMGAPTIASFMVHFAILPVVIFVTLWLAHWEGANGWGDHT